MSPRAPDGEEDGFALLEEPSSGARRRRGAREGRPAHGRVLLRTVRAMAGWRA